MPRVYNPAVNVRDHEDNILFSTSFAFLKIPTKPQLRKQLGQHVVAEALARRITDSMIGQVEVVGEDLSFEVTNSARKDGKRKVSAAPKSNRPSGKSSTKRVSKAPSTNKRSGPTKKDQAIALYKDNSDKSRKDVIQLFVDQLGMTPAGASTYYSMAKKVTEG